MTRWNDLTEAEQEVAEVANTPMTADEWERYVVDRLRNNRRGATAAGVWRVIADRRAAGVAEWMRRRKANAE